MSIWHDLYKAKEHLQRISNEISRIIKEHNGLTKKEIAVQSEKLAQQVTDSLAVIEQEYNEMTKNIVAHRKALASKSRFLKRHNRNGFV